jgi:hypothetical protein
LSCFAGFPLSTFFAGVWSKYSSEVKGAALS